MRIIEHRAGRRWRLESMIEGCRRVLVAVARGRDSFSNARRRA